MLVYPSVIRKYVDVISKFIVVTRFLEMTLL